MSRRDARARARAALAERKAAARARRGPDPRRRRRRALVVALLVLLLLLLLRCCAEPTPPPPAPADGAPPPGAAASESEPDAPLTAPRIERQQRPAYAPQAAPPPTWLDDLQLQVTARSPRLAACFEGAAHPGLLRWSARVDPRLGTVAEADLEPLRTTDQLDRDHRACALAVLSDPPYRLGAGDGPARVSLVLEF